MEALAVRSLLLRQLLPGVRLSSRMQEVRVTGVQLDSRKVQPGDLFLALPGEIVDGRKYIDRALKAGAVAVFAEAQDLSDERDLVIPVEGLMQQVSAIADRFYGHPSAEMEVVGVTGTNGKTTCTQLLAQLYAALGETAGVVGTMGYGTMGPGSSTLIDTGMTTPDAIALQEILSELCLEGARHVAMEVSSHSLSQGRVAAVQFKTAVFTNLSRDHLDYHGTMADYAAAKSKLFAMPGLSAAVVNIDDPMGADLAKRLHSDVKCYRYSIGHDNAEIVATGVSLDAAGIRAGIVTPWGRGELRSKLLGEFNLSNLLAVVAVACIEGFSLGDVLAAVATLSPVEGRMELVDAEAGPKVVVDYAHTPDALKQALLSLRMHCRGDLWCVFGCGGDRDPGKRKDMGEIAATLADHVVITSDNPRNESPLGIIEDIQSGAGLSALVKVDRGEAIQYAVVRALEEDVVLIAGKGHERYQVIGDTQLPFSDIMQARFALRRRGG